MAKPGQLNLIIMCNDYKIPTKACGRKASRLPCSVLVNKQSRNKVVQCHRLLSFQALCLTLQVGLQVSPVSSCEQLPLC